MAIYRYVRTSFWQDDFVSELTPEEKYFYIYLMTNLKTTQCGIFKLVKKIAEAETGYSRETIEKLIKRFIEYGKIAYCEETKEVMILNWMKYNFSSSKNTIACINKELKEVENKEFIDIMYKLCVDRGYDVESIFKDIEVDEAFEENQEILATYEGPSEDLGEKEIKKEKEKSSSKKEKTKNKEDERRRVLLEFNKNIHQATKNDKKKIRLWSSEFEEGVIIAAIKEAVKYDARHIGYIETVIKNWSEHGITTVEKLNKSREKEKIDNNNMCNSAAYQYVD